MAEAVPDADGAVGLWAYAGTSQSAALVTGAAALLLDRGASPEQVPRILQRSAQYLDWQCQSLGCGTGTLHLSQALRAPLAELGRPAGDFTELAASILPWAKDEWWQAVLTFEIAVVDDAGQPVRNAEVYGRAWSSAGEVMNLQCHSDGNGTCSIRAFSGPSDVIGACSYVGQIETVRVSGVNLHPTPLAFATDGLEVLQAGMAAEESRSGSLLGLHWDAVNDPILGRMLPSCVALNQGAGLSASPLGVFMGHGALASDVVVTASTLDLDGAGLSSSPLGLLPLAQLRMSGAGQSSSPLGLLGMEALDLTLFSSSGFVAGGLGASAAALALPASRTGGSGLSSSPLGFHGEPILLSQGEILGSPPVGSVVADSLQDGTWIGGQQVSGATRMVATGTVADTTTGQSAGPGAAVEIGLP